MKAKKITKKINNVMMGAVIGCAIGSIVGLSVKKEKKGLLKRFFGRKKNEEQDDND